MNPNLAFDVETDRTLGRLLARLEVNLSASISTDPQGWQVFTQRLQARFPALFKLYLEIYGTRYDFFFHLEDLLTGLARAWFERPPDLRELDAARELNPDWFVSNRLVGGVIYVDLFAGDIEGVRTRIPYFQELGLTYLHLMPLFKAPDGENDGGYAVSSYRELHPPLGTMEQLAALARDLRMAGISLVVDLVFNHTSDEHAWALQARNGRFDYQEMYHIFPDRSMPDAYERTLREIFPDEHPGAFTYFKDIRMAPQGRNVPGQKGGWVWTTFHSYQWDLNYSNPAVFNRMVDEMLFLANQGVEVLRLDAVAFTWKQMGTNCENLPGAHALIRTFNAAARIAAPGLLFKSEAIVHPDEVVKYIDPAECQLSYNPLLMALLWNSLATRQVNLLAQAIQTRARIHPGCAWVNYVRGHDDIGWTFSDEDAAMLGVSGGDHRRFLNDFYLGRFPGSFGRGLPFQENPKTGDSRVSGTCASLAGLEKAVTEEGQQEVDLAIRRILLIHAIIMTVGGIPLIYLGDEVATLNDYSYRDDPSHSRDSRWVHRPRADWERFGQRYQTQSIPGKTYQGLQKLIRLRKKLPAFSGGELELIATENQHVLGYVRTHGGKRVLVLANFSEQPQAIPAAVLERNNARASKRLYGSSSLTAEGEMQLAPYDFLVLG
ncbi:MAG TPA: alpha-amylase family glycosyl hydrolase [Anaerolineales bacterium]|jgi:glycosidase